MDALTRDISECKHKQRSGVIKVPAATATASAKKEHPRNDILRLDYIYKRKIPPRTAIATAQETLQWTRSRLEGLFWLYCTPEDECNVVVYLLGT